MDCFSQRLKKPSDILRNDNFNEEKIYSGGNFRNQVDNTRRRRTNVKVSFLEYNVIRRDSDQSW